MLSVISPTNWSYGIQRFNAFVILKWFSFLHIPYSSRALVFLWWLRHSHSPCKIYSTFCGICKDVLDERKEDDTSIPSSLSDRAVSWRLNVQVDLFRQRREGIPCLNLLRATQNSLMGGKLSPSAHQSVALHTWASCCRAAQPPIHLVFRSSPIPNNFLAVLWKKRDLQARGQKCKSSKMHWARLSQPRERRNSIGSAFPICSLSGSLINALVLRVPLWDP